MFMQIIVDLQRVAYSKLCQTSKNECSMKIVNGFKYTSDFSTYRSSHQRCSIIKGVLRNFAKFTGKHLCQRLFFKVAGLRPATLLKKSLRHRCFPVNFAKFLRTPFFTEHLRWLLLHVNLNIYIYMSFLERLLAFVFFRLLFIMKLRLSNFSCS